MLEFLILDGYGMCNDVQIRQQLVIILNIKSSFGLYFFWK